MAKKKIDTPRSFAHDSNARNSSKIIRLRMTHGAAGYGLYFMLLERLRDAPDYMELLDYEVLAYDFRENMGMIRSVIEDFGLFAITEDGFFYSETLTSRLSSRFITSTSVEVTQNSENSELSNSYESPESIESIESPDSPEGSDSLDSPDGSDVPPLCELIEDASCDDLWLEDLYEKYELDNEYLTELIRCNFYDYCCDNCLQFGSLDDLKSEFIKWLVPQS